jgi:hypothetical protein
VLRKCTGVARVLDKVWRAPAGPDVQSRPRHRNRRNALGLGVGRVRNGGDYA